MAGTIPISMTQQFTSQGVPLVGGKLYIFQAATTTPQSAYSDSGLTAALPNPITLDSSGRVPQFFLADGTIKVRLTDSAGTVQAEWDNLLVIGPSGGGGGGGATVDATTIFQTGDLLWQDVTGVRSGWVRDNGRTIGSSSSGSSERANSDCQNLFVFGWGKGWSVVGGAGASAAADWAANKQITLPDKRGRAPFGLDDMGNSAAGRLANATFTTGDAITAGALGGEATHTLSTSEIPSHNHTLTDPGHSHNIPARSSSAPGGGTDVVSDNGSGFLFNLSSSSATTGITLASTGGGGAHNNMPPFVLGTFYRKL